MTKYREIIRLTGLGFSQRDIMAICGVTQKTVVKVQKRAWELKLSWLLDEAMTDTALQKLMFSNENRVSPNKRMPDYTYIHKELLRNGVSKKLMWTEYRRTAVPTATNHLCILNSAITSSRMSRNNVLPCILDSKTGKHLLEDLDILGFCKSKFVMDRGFYSEDNINGLYREHVKFLVGVKLSLKFIKSNLDAVYDDIRMFTNYDESIETYDYTVQTEWDYTQERPYKGDVIKDKRRIYIHYFYSIEKGAEDEQAFDKHIAGLCRELIEDKPVESHRKAYEQFFEVKTTPKRGRQVYYKEDAIKEAIRYLGYFALITNETMDAFTALHLYRMKDVIEKAFENIKERLNMRRLLVSSEKGLDGKIFTEFVALVLISHLDHKMMESELYKKYTMQSLLDKLDVIECFEDANHSLKIGEMLVKQTAIYEALGVEAPTTSC